MREFVGAFSDVVNVVLWLVAVKTCKINQIAELFAHVLYLPFVLEESELRKLLTWGITQRNFSASLLDAGLVCSFL